MFSHYNTYADIKRRKNESRTYFFDRAAERLNRRMMREIVLLQYNIALRWKILRLATPKKVAYFLYIQLEYGAKTTRYSLY